MYSDNSAEAFLEFFPLLELPLEIVSEHQREISPPSSCSQLMSMSLESQNFRIGKDLRDQLDSNNYIIHQLSELLRTQSFQDVCHQDTTAVLKRDQQMYFTAKYLQQCHMQNITQKSLPLSTIWDQYRLSAIAFPQGFKITQPREWSSPIAGRQVRGYGDAQ